MSPVLDPLGLKRAEAEEAVQRVSDLKKRTPPVTESLSVMSNVNSPNSASSRSRAAVGEPERVGLARHFEGVGQVGDHVTLLDAVRLLLREQRRASQRQRFSAGEVKRSSLLFLLYLSLPRMNCDGLMRAPSLSYKYAP